MEQPEPNIGPSRRPRSPVYYVQVRRESHPVPGWVAVEWVWNITTTAYYGAAWALHASGATPGLPRIASPI